MKKLEETKKRSIYVGRRRLVKAGSAYYISVPAEWFEVHGLDPEKLKELLVVADKDIRIVNPEHEKHIYIEVSRLVKQTKL